jgi:hypothetical protein
MIWASLFIYAKGLHEFIYSSATPSEDPVLFFFCTVALNIIYWRLYFTGPCPYSSKTKWLEDCTELTSSCMCITLIPIFSRRASSLSWSKLKGKAGRAARHVS